MSNQDQTLLPLIFLSHFRRGLGVGIKNSLFQNGLRAAFPVTVDIAGNGATSVEGGIEVYGPGDVIGIDRGVVIHTNPLPGVDDFEPNYMPHVEFDAPDLPWRFTPAEPDNDGHLRPWLCVVTLADSEFERVADMPEPLPVIKVMAPASSLPNLEQSWAWAHVQIIDALDTDEAIEDLVQDLLDTAPERIISRLVAPRRLLPHTTYHAFLVPTTEAGRLAGLGHNPATNTQGEATSAQDLAWILDLDGGGTTPGPLPLPVYYEWRFHTGAGGDFESAVRKLQARVLDPRVGSRLMDVSQPGYGIPALTPMGLEAALRALDSQSTSAPGTTFTEALAALLNLPHQLQDSSDPTTKYTVTLLRLGTGIRDEVITMVALLMHIDPRVAEAVVDTAPSVILSNVTKIAADSADTILKKVGGEVAITPITRTGYSVTLIRAGTADADTLIDVLTKFLAIAPDEAKQMVSTLPQDILTEGLQDDAEAVTTALQQAGAEVAVTAPAGAGDQSAEAEPARVVAPPLYGRWHAALKTVDPHLPHWFTDLNLDPRSRAAAGLGTRVIREQQEQLMAAAWEQVGAINEANQKLLEAQLAREASSALYDKHFVGSEADELLPLTVQVHARTRNGNATVRKALHESRLPDSAVTGVFQRVTRPSGKVARRTGLRSPGKFVTKFNDGDITGAGPPPEQPDGAVTLESVVQALQDPEALRATKAQLTATAVLQFPSHATFQIDLQGQTTAATTEDTSRAALDSPEAAAFRQAASHIQQQWHDVSPPAPMRGPLDIGQVVSHLFTVLNPRLSIPARTLPQIDRATHAPAETPDDALEPILAAPEFDYPMSDALIKLSQDYVLPGLEHVPNNTIGLLQTNPQFVEAYMVGLNHEMARELLWREYPTDQRGSYFRQFWDVRGTRLYNQMTGADNNTPEALKDIPDLHTWHNRLGQHPHGVGGAQEQLVLLIRGDLLRKYPTAVIYAVKARWNAALNDGAGGRDLDPDGGTKVPIFSGSLLPDVTFLGFDLREQAVRGVDDVTSLDQGWFFVIQEQPSEPRFGLDVADGVGQAVPGNNWKELTWGHLLGQGGQLDTLTYVDVVQHVPTIANANPDPVWGDTAAGMASILLQTPVRIAVHGSVMLALTAPPEPPPVTPPKDEGDEIDPIDPKEDPDILIPPEKT